MRLALCGTAMVLSMALCAVSAVGQDKGKDKVTKVDPSAQDLAMLAQTKEAVGKVAAVDVKAGTMTLTIEIASQEPKNPTAMANVSTQMQLQQQQLMQYYQQYLNAKSAAGKQQAMVRYQNKLLQMQNAGMNLQNMVTTVKTAKDYKLDIMDGLKVARKQPADQYDEMGERIKYSSEELEKRKSKDIPEGYTAAPEDLQTGQTVKLFLSPPKKKTSESASSPPATGDNKNSASDLQPRTQVRMALIVEDAPPPPDEKTKKKKKDN
jgi:hypothetical protein